MRVHDFRELDSQEASERLVSAIGSNTDEVVAVIGHGNSDGSTTCGIGAEMIPPNGNLKILWLYSCNSARRIAIELSNRGIITLGFATEVLAFNQSIPNEIEIVEELMVFSETLAPTKLHCSLRQELLEAAKGNLIADKKILEAALMNHTRLSLRVFPT